ncbi:hypothetical protein C8J56DRAFT_1027502 [Mycena floridula]|nr:hypothetical protein C8J56DRAFT_1027502 [Mycena floridula]
MPLFKSHNNNDETINNNHHGMTSNDAYPQDTMTGQQNFVPQNEMNSGLGHHTKTGHHTTTGMGQNSNMPNDMNATSGLGHHGTAGMAHGTTGMSHGMNANDLPPAPPLDSDTGNLNSHHHNHNPGMTQSGANAYGSSGLDQNMSGHHGQSGANAHGVDQNISGQHGHTSLATKAENALLGSSSIRQQGLKQEQEAKAARIQGAELAEAERLEREALMRREKAVNHGAHPDNRHLGSNPNGPGAVN